MHIPAIVFYIPGPLTLVDKKIELRSKMSVDPGGNFVFLTK